MSSGRPRVENLDLLFVKLSVGWLFHWCVLVIGSVTDDRFILKQMKRPEVDSFVEFANDYFKHLRRALDESVM